MAGTFTDTTITIGAGKFYDEDIEFVNAEETNCKVLYHNGDADWAWDVLDTPYKVVNPGVDDTLYYNNGNALATVGNNKYVNYWVFITPDTSEPVNIVLGTEYYNTIALVRAGTIPSLGDLPSPEFKLIYKITYQNDGGTPDYIETTDYRASSNLPIGSYVAADHGALAGLADDDHPQYSPKASPTFTGTVTVPSTNFTIGSTTFSEANMQDLIDNSMADTLHRHSELSASDGTPDRALVVDADGKVGIGTAIPLTALQVGIDDVSNPATLG
ncbi:unnamed protein product, partial [marine sediment metagenome]